MKSTFLQIGIQREFPQLVKNPMYYFDMAFFLVFGIGENTIQIHNNKDIMFFCKDLIDIALECCRSVGQSKRYYLILKMAVFGPESSLSLISFGNSHPVVGTGEIELGKPLYLPQSIQELSDKRQWISVLDCEVVKSLIINTKPEAAI